MINFYDRERPDTIKINLGECEECWEEAPLRSAVSGDLNSAMLCDRCLSHD